MSWRRGQERTTGYPAGLAARWTTKAAVALTVLLVASACVGRDPSVPAPGSDDTDGEAVAVPDGQAVTIPADGLELVGTLRLPPGDGPHPGVLIVHGSGPNDRRGQFSGQLGLSFPSPVPVYEEVAIALQERGYAVLTWDKRTCGPFSNCGDNEYPEPPEDLTIGVLVDDAAAAFRELRDHPQVGEVAVIGHSKGGTMALDLPARGVEPAALVLAAAPFEPIDEVLEGQADTLEELLRQTGHDAEDAAEQVAPLREGSDELGQLRDGTPPFAHDDLLLGASRAFWASWLDLSDRSTQLLADYPSPVLVVGGENDWNVPPESIEGWRPHLRDGDDLVIIDELTHAFTRLSEPDPSAFTLEDLGTQVEPSFLTRVGDWLDQVVDGDAA